MALRPDIVDVIRKRFEVRPDFVPGKTMTATTGEPLPPAPRGSEIFIGVDFGRPGNDYTVCTYRNEARIIAIWSPRLR